ncbi:MAG: LysM peptidoglycan-binding domain-containing protein [Muribaculaceae bacterium]|nr:LysM peptidoglycan-binding domain-containing protein [Muribaculaceae bacterium]
MRKKYVSFLGIGIFTLAALAQNNVSKLPVVEVQGKKYYMYEAKKNQTFFNIANDLNWDLDELINVNSKVLSPMSKGTKIYYPVKGNDTVVAGDSVVIRPDFLQVSSGIEEDSLENHYRPLVHSVRKGETVYSISKMYSVSPETIYSLNPSSRYGIKAGEDLIIRKGLEAKEGKNPEYYIVREGDTLYQLARKFNTNVASILTLNPGVSEYNFKAGSTIRVPQFGEGLKVETHNKEEKIVLGFSNYQTEKGETWENVAEKTGVSVEDLKNANSNVTQLKSNTMLGVPVLGTDTVTTSQIVVDSREESLSGLSDIYSEVHRYPVSNDSIKHIRIGLVLSEPSSKKDIDFTRGFLTGINKLKNSGYKIKFKVFDGRGEEDVLIDSLGSYGAQVLFTTYDKNTPDFFADYALVSQTPVINTFDMKDEHFLTNPFFVNILTPSSYFNDEIANYLRNIKDGSKLIVLGSDSDANDSLLSALQCKWDSKDVINLSLPEQLSGYEFDYATDYIIFGNFTKKEDIVSLVDIMGTLKENDSAGRLNFVGRPNWMIYDESLHDKFQKSDVMIPARFYYDKNSPEGQTFLSEYKSMFKVTPAKSFPMYSTMGYDESLHFIPMLAANDGDINRVYSSTSGVQSEFELYRPTNWSGIINPVVYLVRFSPQGNIVKQKVK